jgi:hypothetical protein
MLGGHTLSLALESQAISATTAITPVHHANRKSQRKRQQECQGYVFARSIYLPAALMAAPRRDSAALLCAASEGDDELVPASFLPLRTKRTESLSSEEEGEEFDCM